MPMARQALHLAGEHIHVAVWPTVNEMHQLASRHYAFEGRCFVLAAGMIMRVKDMPKELRLTPELDANPESFLCMEVAPSLAQMRNTWSNLCVSRRTLSSQTLISTHPGSRAHDLGRVRSL
jgi:hypothetical protein